MTGGHVCCKLRGIKMDKYDIEGKIKNLPDNIVQKINDYIDFFIK